MIVEIDEFKSAAVQQLERDEKMLYRGNPRIILLEFNELCPSLMQRFMFAGKVT